MLKELRHIRYRRFLFSVNEYFLAVPRELDADINYCIQCPGNTNGALELFYTLLIDLRQPEEHIYQNIYHRTRSEVQSFISNQHFDHRVLYAPSRVELKTFMRLFNTFAAEKKIRKAEGFRLEAYRKAGILAISFIRQQGKFLCINFYRLTQERAVNIYSFTVKNEQLNGTQLGRAHRALHWLDLIEFKKAGAYYYDFCGWYAGKDNQELLNINRFKEQFSTHKVQEYAGVIYKNKLLLLLKRFIR